MKSNMCSRLVSVLLTVLIVLSCVIISTTLTKAAVLPDGYEKDFEEQGKTYDNMGVLEDQYDLIEPSNNRYPIISPSSKIDAAYPPLFTGTYEEVENYFKKNGMTDGMPIVPPTKIKAEKFLGYSSYKFNDVVATVNGKTVKAYQVAANAIMAGCSAEHLPICIAFTEALSNNDYLDSLKSGKLTPMMYVNGPVARQIGIDNTQGMTTEETNIGIGRFMELALINLAGIKRNNAFGNVQPLVFSENEEVCLNIGWKPHHVEKGYQLNDNVITATSFAMWGNNVTPATDLPEEIMKVLAWDITEKNLGGLGSASIEDNANAKRLIFITESVATALSGKYKTKDALENALIENARRPLWMRTYAYYYANTGGALSKSFSKVYDELKSAKTEDAKLTASPAWMNGITYANIETVATMRKGNTDIIITGDSSRNKTQVMPGGMSVTKTVKLSNKWDSLVTSMNYNPIEFFSLEEQNHSITPPSSVPSVLTNGTYRILDPTNGSTYLTRAGRVYFDTSSNTLYYYAQGASSKSSVVLDPVSDSAFISYITNLGYNSSFTVSGGKLTGVSVRFSSNSSKLKNNTTALTSESFNEMTLEVHANNVSGSNAAGGLAKDGATVVMSDTVKSFTANLDGTLVMGDSTNTDFVKLNGTKVTVNPTVKAGATTVIGSKNSDSTYRTMTFVNGGDGTYTITYNTANTLTLAKSSYYLKGTFNEWNESDAFEKTGNDDVITITKELSKGTYEFKIYKSGADEYFGNGSSIADTVNRTTLTKTGGNITFNATGGKYEFKYEISTNKLSVFYAENKAMNNQPTVKEEETTEKNTTEGSTTEEKTTEENSTPVESNNKVAYYFTNNYAWSSVNAYIWSDKTNDNVAAWPGTKLKVHHKNSQGQDVYKVVIDRDKYNYVIFNGDNAQTVDINLAKYDTNAFYISGGSDKALTVGTWNYVEENTTASEKDTTEPTTEKPVGMRTLYLNVDAIVTSDPVRFAAYTFGDADPMWTDMTLVSGNTYTVEVPSNYENVIFGRMNADDPVNDFDKTVYNKTDDLKISDDYNLYTITGWGSEFGANIKGEWGVYSPEDPTVPSSSEEDPTTPSSVEKPTTPTAPTEPAGYSKYVVKGDITFALNKTDNAAIVENTISLPAGCTYGFNVVDTETNTRYGRTATYTDEISKALIGPDWGKCTLNTTGGDYKFTFNINNNKLTVTKVNNDNLSTYRVKGSFALALAKTDTTIVENTVDLPAGTYRFVIMDDATGSKLGRAVNGYVNSVPKVLCGNNWGYLEMTVTEAGKFKVIYNTKTNNVTVVPVSADDTGYMVISNDFVLSLEKSKTEGVVEGVAKLEAGTYKLGVTADDGATTYGRGASYTDTMARAELGLGWGKIEFTATGGNYKFIYNTKNKKLEIKMV